MSSHEVAAALDPAIVAPPAPSRAAWRDSAAGWAFIAPSLVVVAAFTLYPIVQSVIHSFTGAGGAPGLQQVDTLIHDEVLHKVFRNNLVFALFTVPISIGIALGMALWVNGRIRGRGFLRLAFFTPTILPMVAAASIWLYFYTPGYGPIDTLMHTLGLPGHNWLGDPLTALPSIMVVTIWKEAGFFMIFYLAGLQNMSPELEEASMLEGASAWYHFRRVTLPLLMPTTLFVTIVAVTNSFKHVEHIFVMTRGGPDNASSLLLFYIYKTAFTFFDDHYAAILTVVLMATLLLLAFLQFRVVEKRVHYQ
jgi:sn-glycerol 3-phosphate transport system permease protein